jgi:hypothetical protein
MAIEAEQWIDIYEPVVISPKLVAFPYETHSAPVIYTYKMKVN